ncbi:hypothetical protein [Tellurirhabdus rosea]|uniref:hypothetical protein n=1 Tax=Tellurirhabdus rosea TaxID=2674997 RepID=UPI0022541E10|nr:hypothetical protein [Tellurirhabdus rosea]
MRLYCWLFGLLLMGSQASSFTVAQRIRYHFNNGTGESVRLLVQLQAADAAFTRPDTFAVHREVSASTLDLTSLAARPFQKVILITDRKRYETPVFAYEGRCSGYRLDLEPTGLTLTPDRTFRYQDAIRHFLLFFLTAAFCKMIPHLLLTAAHLNRLIRPFLLINSAAVGLLVLFGKTVAGISPVFVFLVLACPWLIAALEGVVYQRFTDAGLSSGRLMGSVLAGAGLWQVVGLVFFLNFLLAC